MRTKLLLTGTLSDDTKGEIKYLQEASSDLFESIYQWYCDQESVPTLQENLTEAFSKETGATPENINSIIAIIYRLLQIFKEPENTAKDLLEDLKEGYSDLIKDVKILEDRFLKVESISQKYNLLFKIEETRSIGTTSLKSSSMTVILKPVIENRFDQSSDIKDYSPKVLQYEASVLFEMQKSDDEKMTFQMSPDNFERFLNHLISIQLELKAVSDEIKKK